MSVRKNQGTEAFKSLVNSNVNQTERGLSAVDTRMASPPRLPFIGGYQGHVPELYTTRAGLGTNFRDASIAITASRPLQYSKVAELTNVPDPPFHTTVNPDYAIPGYKGHIPRSRDRVGNTFAKTSFEALASFEEEHINSKSCLEDHLIEKERETRESEARKEAARARQTVPGTIDFSVDNPLEIYKIQEGLVPRYSGYIPGQKFRHGSTNTQLSTNSLNKSSLQH